MLIPFTGLATMMPIMLFGSDQLVREAGKLLYQELRQRCTPADLIKSLCLLVDLSQVRMYFKILLTHFFYIRNLLLPCGLIALGITVYCPEFVVTDYLDNI